MLCKACHLAARGELCDSGHENVESIASPPIGPTALHDEQPTGNKPEGTGRTQDALTLDHRTGAQGTMSSAPPRRHDGGPSIGPTG
jgi:hypothetical protein